MPNSGGMLESHGCLALMGALDITNIGRSMEGADVGLCVGYRVGCVDGEGVGAKDGSNVGYVESSSCS